MFRTSLDDITLKITQHNSEQQHILLQGVDASESVALPRSMVRWVSTMSLSPEPSHWIMKGAEPKESTSEQLRKRIEMLSFVVPPELFEEYDSDVGLNEHNSLKFQLRVSYREEQAHVDATDYSFNYSNNNHTDRKAPGLQQPEHPVLAKELRWLPYSDTQLQKMLHWFQKPENQAWRKKWRYINPDLLKMIPYKNTSSSSSSSDFSNSSNVQSDTTIRADNICRPCDEKFILASLSPGESLDVTFYLTKGNTKTVRHYGGSPVRAQTASQPVPHVEIVEPIQDIEDSQWLLNECPKKLFIPTTLESDWPKKGRVQIRNPEQCIHCGQCQRISTPNSIAVTDKPGEFKIRVATRGGIPVTQLVPRAIQHLISTCEMYKESLM